MLHGYETHRVIRSTFSCSSMSGVHSRWPNGKGESRPAKNAQKLDFYNFIKESVSP